MVESWRGFRTLLSTSGTFGEYSEIVENDILTTQRFLDVSRFLYSFGWQVWKAMLKVSINGMRLFFPDNSIDFVFFFFRRLWKKIKANR